MDSTLQRGVQDLYSPFGDQPYVQVLPQVQAGVSGTITKDIDELSEAELKEKIERYITDHGIKCSLTPDIGQLVNYIYHDMAGYSFITRDGLFDLPNFEELNVNAWDDVEIVLGGEKKKTDYSFLSPQHALDIHARMFRHTSTLFNDAEPRATADLAPGIRIIAEKVPIVDPGVAISSSIRKVNMSVVSQDKLLENSTLLPEMLDFLRLCVMHGVSMCISGETGAGKTTLAGCLLAEASKTLRTFTIEEGSREWNFVHRDPDTGRVLNSVIHTKTRPNPNNPAQHIDQEALVKDSLRFDPDIIAPGEIRGREAFEVMGVSNTGHTVITTTHSNGTLDTPERIVTLSKKAFDMSDTTLYSMVCRAFPVLVHMESGPDRRRRVTEIREVTGYQDGVLQSQLLYEYVVQDNIIYEGDRCVRVVGRFDHTNPISDALLKRLLKKGATKVQVAPYASKGGEAAWDSAS